VLEYFLKQNAERFETIKKMFIQAPFYWSGAWFFGFFCVLLFLASNFYGLIFIGAAHDLGKPDVFLLPTDLLYSPPWYVKHFYLCLPMVFFVWLTSLAYKYWCNWNIDNAFRVKKFDWFFLIFNIRFLFIVLFLWVFAGIESFIVNFLASIFGIYDISSNILVWFIDFFVFLVFFELYGIFLINFLVDKYDMDEIFILLDNDVGELNRFKYLVWNVLQFGLVLFIFNFVASYLLMFILLFYLFFVATLFIITSAIFAHDLKKPKVKYA